MNYNILETHLIFENNVLTEVAVLWENYGDIRATKSSINRLWGHHTLKDNDMPTLTLFNEVAATGIYLSAEEKKQYFPKHIK